MWHAVAALGVEGDVGVLEPGCGSGNFIGFAPPQARLTGVELDRTTAEVAEHLYGARATIHATAFEELTLEDGSFDPIISNVPFAQVTPHQPSPNRRRHSPHQHLTTPPINPPPPGRPVVAHPPA